MNDQIIVRRKDNPSSRYRAVQYGNSDWSWDPDGITKVAALVLGMNPDVVTTVANERMLDVVRPVLSEFDPAHGKATIEVLDGSNVFPVALGDWVLKPLDGGPMIFVKQFSFSLEFEPLPVEVEASALDELTELIYQVFAPLDDTRHKSLSRSAAETVLQAGWTKP